MADKRIRSKRRKQGQREPIGLTKRRILLIIANHHPEGIEEADLREILRKNDNITEAKGIRSHLSYFEKRKVLINDSKGIGHPNIWKINPDEMIFRSFCASFLRSKQKYEFLKSKYAQQMLTDDFINSCGQNWYDNYYVPLKEEAKSDEEFLEIIGKLKILIGLIDFRGSLKSIEEKLLEKKDKKVTVKLGKAIRKSPLILYYLIFPNEGLKAFVELIEELEPLMLEFENIKEVMAAPLFKIMEGLEGEDFSELKLLLQ